MHERLIEKANRETYIVRFLPGDDIFTRLKEMGVKRMAIFLAIGSIKDVEFRDLRSETSCRLFQRRPN